MIYRFQTHSKVMFWLAIWRYRKEGVLSCVTSLGISGQGCLSLPVHTPFRHAWDSHCTSYSNLVTHETSNLAVLHRIMVMHLICMQAMQIDARNSQPGTMQPPPHPRTEHICKQLSAWNRFLQLPFMDGIGYQWVLLSKLIYMLCMRNCGLATRGTSVTKETIPLRQNRYNREKRLFPTSLLPNLTHWQEQISWIGWQEALSECGAEKVKSDDQSCWQVWWDNNARS